MAATATRRIEVARVHVSVPVVLGVLALLAGAWALFTLGSPTVLAWAVVALLLAKERADHLALTTPWAELQAGLTKAAVWIKASASICAWIGLIWALLARH